MVAEGAGRGRGGRWGGKGRGRREGEDVGDEEAGAVPLVWQPLGEQRDARQGRLEVGACPSAIDLNAIAARSRASAMIGRLKARGFARGLGRRTDRGRSEFKWVGGVRNGYALPYERTVGQDETAERRRCDHAGQRSSAEASMAFERNDYRTER